MIGEAQRLTAFRLLLALAAAVAVTMALLPRPPHLVNVSDKWQHMAAFATLALLAAAAFPRERLWRMGEHLSFGGALIEVLQAIPALHRDCDIMDWVADTVAIAVVLALVGLVRRARAAT